MNINFCTCTNFPCKLHPQNHPDGCTPCIEKNLRLREIPSCFFNLIEGADNRDGDTLEDFASLVLKDNYYSEGVRK